MRTNLTAKTAPETRILDYIEQNATAYLCAKINNGKKTLQGCWNYITAEAKKQAVNGCACIEDSTVFGWAMHYFEEDSIKEGATPKPKTTPKTTAKTTPTMAESQKATPKPKPTPKKQEVEQISFFDLEV